MTGVPAQQRNKPRQSRAHDTVEVIVDAMAHVLERDGYDAASTNRVAARAGVSIGSVYRYFDDKQALIDAVVARVSAEMEREIADALIDAIALPLEAGVRASVDGVARVIEQHASLLRVLVDQVPHTGGIHALGDVEQRLSELGRAFLVQHLGPRPRSELDALVFVTAGTTLASSLRIGLARPRGIDREVLVDHVTTMISGLLAQA